MTEANPALAQCEAYEDWDELEAKQIVVDVNGMGAKPIVSLFWTGEQLTQHKGLTFAWRLPKVSLPGIGSFKLTPNERILFGSLVSIYRSTRNLDQKGGVVRSMRQVMLDLDR